MFIIDTIIKYIRFLIEKIFGIRNKEKKGFSLIELSIAVFIMSILFAGTSVIFGKIKGVAQESETQTKLDVIESALQAYFLENQYLPCPARLDVDTTNSNSGVGLRDGAGSDEACVLTNIFRNTGDTTDELALGAIPYKDLDLASDYTYDGFGNKFSYVVDMRFTHSSDQSGSTDITENFAETPATNAILIKDSDDDNVKTDVIVVIISHGVNGSGAYADALQNKLPTNTTDEYDNVYDSSASPTFDNHFVDDDKNSGYDDVIKYIGKYELIENIGIERIGCAEGDIPDYNFTGNSVDYTITWSSSSTTCGSDGFCEYGLEVQSADSCNQGNYPDHFFSTNSTSPFNPSRKCLTNGQWSDVMYPCIQGCGDADATPTTLLSVLDAISGDDDAYANSHLDDTNKPWRRVALGETVTLTCEGTKTGTVTVTCQDGASEGTWIHSSGNCVDDSEQVP